MCVCVFHRARVKERQIVWTVCVSWRSRAVDMGGSPSPLCRRLSERVCVCLCVVCEYVRVIRVCVGVCVCVCGRRAMGIVDSHGALVIHRMIVVKVFVIVARALAPGCPTSCVFLLE